MKEQIRSKRTLVAGLGNPLIGDDSFGTQVLQRLRRYESKFPPHILLADCHTDLLSQIEAFPEYDRVVIVDAILDPGETLGQLGQIVLLDEEKVLSMPETSPSVHQMSPLLAVKLFRRLYPASPTRITLVGICVDQIRCESGYLKDNRITDAANAVLSLLTPAT